MAITIPSTWHGLASGGLAAVAPQPVRAEHVERIVGDVQLTYSSRMRCLFSSAFTLSTTSATLLTVFDEVPVHTSRDGATGYTVQIIGSQVEVEVTVDDGAASASATVTQSGAGTASATGTITTAPPVASDAALFLTIKFRATSGTATLLGVALRERDLTSGEL